MDALGNISHRQHSQREQVAPGQVANNAGGFSFAVTPEVRLYRFLTLGVEGGTFYVREQALAKDNAQIVVDFATKRTQDLVNAILEISLAGRAPRQNPALFALAAASALGDVNGRKAALNALPQVARTGTHLFQFAKYVELFRGWGRGLRNAVGRWYLDKDNDALAYQLLKYQQREGWSHRDLLRLAHPVTNDAAKDDLFKYVVSGELRSGQRPKVLDGYLAAKEATSLKRVVEAIQDTRLSWEMLPTQWLNERAVWEALLANGLPTGALVRQLPRLTRLGLLDNRNDITRRIVTQLTDMDALRKARMHPINMLVAQQTYASGQSARGDGTWQPVRKIVDALDDAFYKSFGTLESTGARYMLALDVSGSMSWHPIANMVITPKVASAAMAMATLHAEPDSEVVAFTSGSGSYSAYGGHRAARGRGNAPQYLGGISPLGISPRQRLDDVIRVIDQQRMGGTDCALPMLYALNSGIQIDTFVVYTDNETWAGSIHPHEALRLYRERVNPAAKLVVVGMESTGFSIADPNDAGMLDVAGFDSAVPNLIANFGRKSA